MKKVFIHIGAHKSASTTIQANIRKNKERILKEHDLTYFDGQEIHSTLVGMHFRKLSKSAFNNDLEYYESLNAAKLECKSTIEKTLTNRTLISWEGLLGHSSLDKYQGIYTHSERVSESLLEIFSKFDPQVLLIIRRQDDFIESCYLQQIKENRSLSFDEFTEKLNIKNLSWLSVIDDLQRKFECNFSVIPFEAIKKTGTSGFLEYCLSTLLNEKISMDGFSIVEQSNASFSMKGVELSREILPHIAKQKRAELNKVLFQNFSSKKYEKAKFLNEFHRKLIRSHYFEENSHIFKSHIIRPTGIDEWKDIEDYWLKVE